MSRIFDRLSAALVKDFLVERARHAILVGVEQLAVIRAAKTRDDGGDEQIGYDPECHAHSHDRTGQAGRSIEIDQRRHQGGDQCHEIARPLAQLPSRRANDGNI